MEYIYFIKRKTSSLIHIYNILYVVNYVMMFVGHACYFFSISNYKYYGTCVLTRLHIRKNKKVEVLWFMLVVTILLACNICCHGDISHIQKFEFVGLLKDNIYANINVLHICTSGITTKLVHCMAVVMFF